LIGCHTAYYAGFAARLIERINFLAFIKINKYVMPGAAKPGDEIILNKASVIESARILSVLGKKAAL